MIDHVWESEIMLQLAYIYSTAPYSYFTKGIHSSKKCKIGKRENKTNINF